MVSATQTSQAISEDDVNLRTSSAAHFLTAWRQTVLHLDLNRAMSTPCPGASWRRFQRLQQSVSPRHARTTLSSARTCSKPAGILKLPLKLFEPVLRFAHACRDSFPETSLQADFRLPVHMTPTQVTEYGDGDLFSNTPLVDVFGFSLGEPDGQHTTLLSAVCEWFLVK